MTIQDALVIGCGVLAVVLWIAIWVGERADRYRMSRERAAWAAMLSTGDRLPTAPERVHIDHTTEADRRAYIEQSARTVGGIVPEYRP